jgi:TP901 family phage tail tape measure protein
MSDGQVVIDITADDAQFRRSLKGLGKVAAVGLSALAIAMAAIGGAALKSSIDFNKGMANVASLIPGNIERVKELKSTVQDMAVQFGKDTTDLTDGLYQVVSAFGDTADTAKVLETNVKAATAGVASTTDAINLTSAVTKAYGDTSAEAVQKASDLALMTVRLGQTTFPELAASIGKVTPLTNELGVSQEQLFATMATLTGVTGGAAEVSTQLRGAMQSLMAPTADAAKAIKDAGYEDAKAMLAKEGLAGSMKILTDAAKKSGKPLQDYVSSIEGQTLALALGGPQADVYAEKLAAMGDAAGATDAAFAEQTTGINALGFAFDQLKQVGVTALQKLGDAISNALGDEFQSAVDTVKNLMDSFTSNLELGLTPIQSIRGALTDAFGPEAGKKFDKLREVVDNLVGVFEDFAAWFQDNSDTISSFGDIVFNLATSIGSSEAAVKGLIGGLVAWKAIGIASTVVSTTKALITHAAGVWSNVAGWAAFTAAKIADKAETLAIMALMAKDTIVRGLNTASVIAGTVAQKAAHALKQGSYMAMGIALLAKDTAAKVANTVAQWASIAAQKAAAVASKVWAAAQWLVNAALSANPIGIVVVLIAGLIAAIVYLWKNNEKFRAIVTKAWSAVKDGISKVVNWLKTAPGKAFEAIKNAVMKYHPLGIIISNWSKIKAFIGTAATAAKTAAINAFAALKDGAAEKFNAVVAFVKDFPARLVRGMGNIKDKFLTIGRSISDGIRQGLVNTWNGLVSKLKGLTDLLPKAVKKLLGIASPSRVFAWIGEMITKGWSTSLEKGAKAVVGAVEDTVSSIIDAANSPILASALQMSPAGVPATYRPGLGPVATTAVGSSSIVNSRTTHIVFQAPVRTYSEMVRAQRDIEEGLVR